MNVTTSANLPDSIRVDQFVLLPLLLSLAMGTLCYLAVGASLGLFFGGIIFATLLAPPIILAQPPGWKRAVACTCIADGIAIVWLVAIFFSSLTFGQWLQCFIVLTVFVAAGSSLSILLQSLKIQPVICAAITMTLTLLWLTWPIWLSPWLGSTRVVAWLVASHPLMAINGILQTRFGIWSQMTLAYRLTNLGQDVSYQLPTSIAGVTLFHTIFAAACLFAARLRGKSSSPIH